MLKFLIGNRRVYDYELKIDGDLLGSGDAIEHALEDIVAGVWMIKRKQDDDNDDALVKISYDVLVPSNSPNFLINTPAPGWVRVIVSSSETEGMVPVRGHFALQLEWGDDNKQEFIFEDGVIDLCQDTIR